MSELSETKRRIVERLKRVESATASELATEFHLTDTAIRQHLDSLEGSGFVARHAGEPDGRGRPPVHWRLTPLSDSLFPDRHSDLTVELMSSIRTALGDDALDQVVAARAERQLLAYQRNLPDGDTHGRVGALAALRTAEGYLAEVHDDGDGRLTLTEHHCPIHDAANTCASLCSAELSLFQRALGPDVTVTRTHHLLSGDARCSYRINPSPGRPDPR